MELANLLGQGGYVETIDTIDKQIFSRHATEANHALQAMNANQAMDKTYKPVVDGQLITMGLLMKALLIKSLYMHNSESISSAICGNVVISNGLVDVWAGETKYLPCPQFLQKIPCNLNLIVLL